MALADVYVKLGDVKDSIQAVNKAISIEPANSEYKAMKTKLVASTQPSTKPSKKD
jgi:cytochrome c-type biogenesis protein CcmH/NrfG